MKAAPPTVSPTASPTPSLPPVIDAATAAALATAGPTPVPAGGPTPVPAAAPTPVPAGAVVFCDVRWYLDGRSGHDAYLAGHIPGAVFVDLDRHLAAEPSPEQGRHPLPSAAAFAASLGELGISEHDAVIAYDDSGGMSAGRLVWMLRVLGAEAALLDGGPAACDDELAAGPTVRPATTCAVREWPTAALADADTTGTAGELGAAVVIDARAAERYRGDVEPMDARPGHIPGAVNLPWNGNLDAAGRFLSPELLRERFAGIGVGSGAGEGESAAAPIVYCGSGVSACHNLLALERAGLAAAGTAAAGPARLYPGSWSQWSAQPDRPAAVG